MLINNYATNNIIYFSSVGNGVGRLWPNRGKKGVHGRGPNNVRRLKFIKYCHWMVQTIWNYITGQWTT